MAPKPSVDVIIPSFNGKYLLEKHLPEVIKNTEYLHKIIVVDNGSADSTVEWIKKTYPDVLVVENKTNLIFTKPINQGVEVSNSEYIVLLNNDVRPTKGYVSSTLKYLKDSDVFAVSFNEIGSSWPNLTWENGKIQYSQGKDKKAPYYSAWASGGSAIFNRKIWDKIGGFNEIYAPFYWEDIDICYRAWKCGYKTIWDNTSLVHHEHESTTKTLNLGFVNLIKQRNELLFNWLNVTDRPLVLAHIKFLFTHTLRHPGYIKVILSALFRYFINDVNFKKPNFTLTDKEVFSLINKKYVKN